MTKKPPNQARASAAGRAAAALVPRFAANHMRIVRLLRRALHAMPCRSSQRRGGVVVDVQGTAATKTCTNALIVNATPQRILVTSLTIVLLTKFEVEVCVYEVSVTLLILTVISVFLGILGNFASVCDVGASV